MSKKSHSHKPPVHTKRRALTRKSMVKSGEVPGTLPQLSTAQPSSLTLTLYDGPSMETVQAATLDDVRKAKAGERTIWLDVVGITDADTIRQLGAVFAIDDLALEDVMTFHH